MKIFTKSILAAVAIASTALVACEEPKGADSNGGYGDLGGNLITIGSTRDVTYTECVLLGTVDFPKITSDHTYGIVYMEALLNPEFDYNSKLVYGGMSDKYDKEEYVCIAAEVNSSAADGKFEKQLVHLKPATTYYYRAYVRIGNNINYSSVEKFTTVDPTSEITMSTVDATEILAVAATMNGGVNVGNLQDVNENQEYGFIFTPSVQLNDAEKLTYEYYKAWQLNHFETEDDFEGPREVTTTSNLNGRINCKVAGLIPGTVYYYRTFFKWNGKYFYSPEVKTLKTNGTDVITVGTNPVDEITDDSARLSATVPFEAIGLEVVDAGFMISKKYSNASEFNLKNAVP